MPADCCLGCPGDFTGVNIVDYAKETYRTEYGEPVGHLMESESLRS